MLEDVPVVTFTCLDKPERSAPSAKYLEVILAGLRETYPDFRESALASDLLHGIFNDHEIRILILVLNELRNQLIREERYTDAVDELLIKLFD